MARLKSPLHAFFFEAKGAAALEFAILSPIFLLFGIGMIAYAIYFGAAHSVQQLAADAARISIAGLTTGERSSLVGAFINNNASAYVLIERQGLSYAIAPSTTDPGEYRVTLNYDASSLPIWNLYPPLPLPNHVISYSSLIRLGGT
jgi:Flp pilus assembly protein TadG